MIPTVVTIGADKGGVGKTTLTRALLDYLDDRKRPRRAFDCQTPNGDLKRFCTDAEIVDISGVDDQMKVFDGVDASTLTVIDLPAGMLSPTLQALDDAKLLDEVRAERMRLVLLHVLGPTLSSIAEIGAMAQRVAGGGAKHLLVKNHINQAQFFEWDGEQAQAQWRQMGKVTIEVPQLQVRACETMQSLGGSFSSFAATAAPGRSPLLRGLVRTWLEKVWAEFDRVGLNELLLGA